jgi:hypothetical protein
LAAESGRCRKLAAEKLAADAGERKLLLMPRLLLRPQTRKPSMLLRQRLMRLQNGTTTGGTTGGTTTGALLAALLAVLLAVPLETTGGATGGTTGPLEAPLRGNEVPPEATNCTTSNA